MARCGCVQSCACAVVADPLCPNVTVSGNGTPGAPFAVCVEPTAVTVTDTDTVDMTITGSGTDAAPWDISAVVILTPDADVPNPDAGPAGNLVKFGTTGIYVSCEDVQDCIGNSLGPGLQYDDANNTEQARISTDAGNQVSFGTDNGLFVPNPAATAVSIQADNTDEVCVNTAVSGSGTIGDPFKISAAPVIDPNICNWLSCGPAGLITLPPEAQATSFFLNAGTAPSLAGVNIAAGGTVLPGAQQNNIVVNPSNCRPMLVYGTVTLFASVGFSPGGSGNLIVDAFDTGGSGITFINPQVGFTEHAANPGPGEDGIGVNSTHIVVPTVIPAGGNAAINSRIRIRAVGVAATNGFVRAPSAAFNLIGVLV